MASNFKLQNEEKLKKLNNKYGVKTYDRQTPRRTPYNERNGSKSDIPGGNDTIKDNVRNNEPSAWESNNYNSDIEDVYSLEKTKVKTKTTTTSKLSDKDRKTRIKELNEELNRLSTERSGLNRASVYGQNKYIKEKLAENASKIAKAKEELKELERVGTFTASERKQMEIDDAKAQISNLQRDINAYGTRPSAKVADEYRAKSTELYAQKEKLNNLERQQQLYKDIAEFSEVVNEDEFIGQWKANYRSRDLSEKAARALSTYLSNPTDENKEIAYAYDALAKAYAKNNEKALDDKDVEFGLLSKSLAGYLPQLKGQIVPQAVGGIVGGALGYTVGMPGKGASIGAGIGAGLYSYDTIKGSVFSTLRSMGVDEKTAIEAASDEAVISSLIEGGETAIGWLTSGGSKAKQAIFNAATASVAKGSTNVATKFIANLAGKATGKVVEKAAKAASQPLWKTGVKTVGGLFKDGVTEYGEEGLQQSVCIATIEKAKANFDEKIGKYGEGNIDLHNRPVLTNSDGSISTVDSVTYEIDGVYVVLPTIVRAENGTPKRLETDEEILAHYEKTGEYLGKFKSEGEADTYATQLHYAQEYRYTNHSTTTKDSLIKGGAKVLKDAITGANKEYRAEIHGAGVEGFKIGAMMGGNRVLINNITTEFFNRKTIKLQNEYADDIKNDEESLTALIAGAKESGEGTTGYKLAEEVEKAKTKGNVTREQVKRLINVNETYIKAEEKANTLEATPEKLTTKDTNKTSKKAPVASYEVLDNLTRNNEKITAEDVKNATGFGDKGSQLVADIANQDGMTFTEAKEAVQVAYMSGYTNPDAKPTDLLNTTDVEIEALKAGKLDKLSQRTAAQARAKEATVYEGKVKADENFKKLSSVDQEIFKVLTKDHGMFGEVKDRILANLDTKAEANASHEDGKIEVSLNADKAIFKLLIHEDGHRMEQFDTEEWNVLANALYERAEQLGRRLNTNFSVGMKFDDQKQAHDQAGITHDTRGYFGEVVMEELETLFSSPEEFKSWLSEIDTKPEVKSAWQRFMDFLSKLINEVKSIFTDSKASKEAKAKAEGELAELEHFRSLYKNAYLATRDAVSEKSAEAKNYTNSSKNLEIKINEDYNGKISHSLKWHTDLTKSQVIELVDRLRQVGNPEATRITDTANWYKGRLGGKDLFAIYSTVYGNEPTILYEVSGRNASRELDVLTRSLEVIESERSAIEKSRIVDELLGGDNRVQEKHNMANNNDRPRRRTSNTGYAPILQGKSPEYIGSPAFREVVRNLFEIQAQSEGKSFSLKNQEYLKAVENGDMETAQKMVDEAAKDAGYTEKAFHSTDADFTDFDIDKTSEFNYHGKGIYFSNSQKDVENNYEAYNGPDPWAKIEERAYELVEEKYGLSYDDTLTSDSDIIDKVNECFRTVIDEFQKKVRRINAYLKFDHPLVLEKGESGSEKHNLQEYDGIIDKQVYETINHVGMDENTIHYVVFNPRNIKSAEPVTYDDNGNVIPLSERFNENNKDIRYSLKDSEAVDNVGVQYDEKSKSVAPSFSFKTWNASRYVQDKDTAIKAIMKATGVSEGDAKRYIDNINSIARLIADDKVRLDYDSNLDDRASVLKPNSEYKWTIDMSTLCAKRLLYTGTFDEIQRKMPNTAFNSEDLVNLRSMMMDRGLEVACGICYVESTRREIGTITADFIERYKISQQTGKPITRVNSEGKTVELTKTQDQMKTTADKSTNKFMADKDYTPTLTDLNTTDIDLVKKNHPLVYEAYLNFMNARGQAKPKLLETRAEYKGEILNVFKNKNAVKARNEAGGLRVQSFSDFEVAHLIDMMQIALDMSQVGLKSQAYTKVPEFAEVFGDTGIKINLSLIAKDSGLDENGNLIFDDVEGIPHKEAFRLRTKYSKNVGTILVGKNDEHIKAALADPRIDFVIPFHKSSWKESLYDALGLTGYKDYTDFQNEKPIDEDGKIDKDRKIKNFQPSEYWDETKSGDENAKIYLQMCEEDSRMPKFPQFKDEPGYWKLLIDFKMYDNEGVYSPQMEVKPNFAMDEAYRIMNAYEGGHNAFPVAQDVVDDFIEKYQNKSFSLKVPPRENRTGELLGVIEDIHDGKKDAATSLAKYVDEGVISTVEYGNLIKKYGAIKRGENPYRSIQVPQKTADDKKVSQTVRTILEAKATPEEAIPRIEKMVEDGVFSYEVYTDKQAIKDQEDYLKEYGWNTSYNDWMEDVKNGVVSKQHAVMGWALYNNSANLAATSSSDTERRTATETSLEILTAMVGHTRNAAQALQAVRILKKMSPATQLYSIQKSVNRLQDEVDARYGKAGDEKYVDDIRNAVTTSRNKANDVMAKTYKEGKISRRGGRVVIDSNMVGEPFTFEYAQKVGEDIAKSLETKRNATKKERTFLQHISAQLKRFANEKLPKGEKTKGLTAVEMLRDYIQNRDFYSKAWESAQNELRDKYADDPMLSEFINSGIGMDANINPKNAIFMRALVQSATESRETKANIIRQSALGVTKISENIASKLIAETGAEGEMAQTIQDAAASYVYNVLVEAETDAKKPLDAEKIVTNAIKGAMKDIGITLSDVVASGDGTNAKNAIINKLVTKYAFGIAEATKTAEIVAQQFDAMSKGYANRKLEAMFKTRNNKRKTVSEQMRLLGNLGAFDIGSKFNIEATKRLFMYGDKAPNLKINEELAQQFLKAETDEERSEIEKKIYLDIGTQMPSSFMDKWNAWRYLAMLGNTRTHVRNVAGNAFFAPVVATKNLTATAIESAVNAISSKGISRTKATITASKNDRALLKAAWGDYKNVADTISNGGKYSDSAMKNKYVEEGRKIFKSKLFAPLEWARTKNSEMLEREDVWFSQPHYAYAMAQYCKANNITADQLQRGRAIEPARAYAIKEAQKATYRDTNAFSAMVSEIGRGSRNDKNPVKRATNIAVEGILPFRKTPANILVRGVEYSPIGLLKSLTYDLAKVKKGEMNASEAIDNISAGFTGTMLLGAGVFLAAQGLVRGHGEDDEKERKFNELMGHQAYSLELPSGDSITLDWLAPEALPFFVGVNIWEATKGSDKEFNLSRILNAVSNITEPMLEMSCLQGLNDLIEGIGESTSEDTSGLMAMLASAATSYLTQGIPTLFGQIERTGEENRFTTYTTENEFLTGDMQWFLGKTSAKIPGWDYSQIPYIDAWGRKEASGVALKRGLNNFLNPAYTSKIEESDMEKELLRLFQQTGDEGVFPTRAYGTLRIDGEEIFLTAEQYIKYATMKGEKAYSILTAMTKSSSYKTMTDEEKVRAVNEALDYADEKAKKTITKKEVASWAKKAEAFANPGNFFVFKAKVSEYKENHDDKIDKKEYVNLVTKTAQTDEDAWGMYAYYYDNENTRYARSNGIKGKTYMNFLTKLAEVDQPSKNGKYGSYTQGEAKNALNQMTGLTRQEKSILWQSVNTSWKAYNNPFR